MADEVKATDTLGVAKLVLSVLSICKEAIISFLSFALQYERVKAKKVEDELLLMKAEKRVDEEKDKIEEKYRNTNSRDGIDEFLSK